MVPSELDEDDDIPPASLKTGTINHWNSGMKPKSILVDKPSSVPSLPNIRELDSDGTEISFINRPRYYRGYSDSGTRLKKHVTLR